MQNAAFAGILFFRNKAKTASDRFYKLCAEIFCIGVCQKYGYRTKAEKAAYREEREKKEKRPDVKDGAAVYKKSHPGEGIFLPSNGQIFCSSMFVSCLWYK